MITISQILMVSQSRINEALCSESMEKGTKYKKDKKNKKEIHLFINLCLYTIV